MDVEERNILEHSLRLGEENNRILKRLQRAQRWALFWGFIKFAIIVIPLILGYLYFEPYLNQAIANYQSVREILNMPR